MPGSFFDTNVLLVAASGATGKASRGNPFRAMGMG